MSPTTPQFEVYMSRTVPLRRQRWYWRLRAGNGEVVARSSEAYGNGTDAERGAGDAQAIAARTVKIVRVEGPAA